MFNKVFSFFAVVLFSLQLFIAGASFADNQVADGVVNLVLAAFWGSILLIEVYRLNLRGRLADRLEDLMAEAFVHINKQIHADHVAMHNAEGAKNAKATKTTKANSNVGKRTAKNASKNRSTRSASGSGNSKPNQPVRSGSKRKS